MTRPFTVTVDARVVFDEERRGIAKTTIALYRTMAMLRPSWRFRFFYKPKDLDGTSALGFVLGFLRPTP